MFLDHRSIIVGKLLYVRIPSFVRFALECFQILFMNLNHLSHILTVQLMTRELRETITDSSEFSPVALMLRVHSTFRAHFASANFIERRSVVPKSVKEKSHDSRNAAPGRKRWKET